MIRVTVRLSDELAEGLDRLATTRGLSRSAMLRELIAAGSADVGVEEAAPPSMDELRRRLLQERLDLLAENRRTFERVRELTREPA